MNLDIACMHAAGQACVESACRQSTGLEYFPFISGKNHHACIHFIMGSHGEILDIWILDYFWGIFSWFFFFVSARPRGGGVVFID